MLTIVIFVETSCLSVCKVVEISDKNKKFI